MEIQLTLKHQDQNYGEYFELIGDDITSENINRILDKWKAGIKLQFFTNTKNLMGKKHK